MTGIKDRNQNEEVLGELKAKHFKYILMIIFGILIFYPQYFRGLYFEDEQFPETSRAMRYYKGSEGGFMEVCNSLKKLTDESYADGHSDGVAEGILQGRIQPIKAFLENGGSEEDAKKLLGAPDEEIKEAKKQ